MNTGFNRAEIMRAAWNQARACHRQASTSHHYAEQARSPRIRLGIEPEAPFTRKISEFFAHGLRAAWEQAKRKAAFARLPTNRQTAIQNAVIELACAEAIENFRVAQPKIAAAHAAAKAAELDLSTHFCDEALRAVRPAGVIEERCA